MYPDHFVATVMVPGPCLDTMWVSAHKPCPTSAMINQQWKQSNGRPCVRVQALLVLTVQTPYVSPHVPLDDPLIFPSLLVTPVFLSQLSPGPEISYSFLSQGFNTLSKPGTWEDTRRPHGDSPARAKASITQQRIFLTLTIITGWPGLQNPATGHPSQRGNAPEWLLGLSELSLALK